MFDRLDSRAKRSPKAKGTHVFPELQITAEMSSRLGNVDDIMTYIAQGLETQNGQWKAVGRSPMDLSVANK
jgi:hypothetical protein